MNSSKNQDYTQSSFDLVDLYNEPLSTFDVVDQGTNAYVNVPHKTYKDDLDQVEVEFGGLWKTTDDQSQRNKVDRIAASLLYQQIEEHDRVAENYKQFLSISVSERERIYIQVFNGDFGLFHNVFEKYLLDNRREVLKLKDVPENHLTDTLPKVCEALNLKMKKTGNNRVHLTKTLTGEERQQNTAIKEEKRRLHRLQGNVKEKPASYSNNYYYKKYAKNKSTLPEN